MRHLALWVLVTLTWPGAPHPVHADPPATHTFDVPGGQFRFSGDELTIQWSDDEVSQHWRIAASGHLFAQGEEIDTDRGDRKRLKKFVRETRKMAELVDQVGALVARQQHPDTTADEQEDIARDIADTGKKLEKQNRKVTQVTADLLDRIPELASLQAMFAE